jgi:hypothetical protein
MSQLISKPVYGERDDALFLEEMNALTVHHMRGAKEFARMWPAWERAEKLEDLPFVHAGVFKHLELKTVNENIKHKRTVHSSSTSGVSSRIVLDEKSSKLQSESTTKILTDFIGNKRRPLLVLDSVKSLHRRGELSARVAAAMSLQTLSSEIQFLLEEPENPDSMKWDLLAEMLNNHEELLVYGFSWILWLAWGGNQFPEEIRSALRGKKIHFIHSGGWKKLEASKVTGEKFNSALLDAVDSSSRIVDFYGLVEQLGIIYPLCEHGVRHIPVWADIIVRDTYTLEPLERELGQLQLLNSITYGAPNHSVLTEDIGRILPGECPCGRSGKRFELVGRIPKAELRGCANV